jgi:hypothetical protein
VMRVVVRDRLRLHQVLDADCSAPRPRRDMR